MTANSTNPAPLETIRFGEYLFEQQLISDEQLLAALALHWSERSGRIGSVIAAQGFLSPEDVEAHATAYHGLEVIELGSPMPAGSSKNDASISN